MLIATGGEPVVDKNLPGSEHVLTSDDFFELEELPKRVAVIGAGVYMCVYVYVHLSLYYLFLAMPLSHRVCSIYI